MRRHSEEFQFLVEEEEYGERKNSLVTKGQEGSEIRKYDKWKVFQNDENLIL